MAQLRLGSREDLERLILETLDGFKQIGKDTCFVHEDTIADQLETADDKVMQMWASDFCSQHNLDLRKGKNDYWAFILRPQ